MNRYLMQSLIRPLSEKIWPEWKSSALPPDEEIKKLGIEYQDYCKDDRLGHLLKGKRIAFVCPSPHLNGMGLGKVIDAYDIVVRAGTLSPIPENLHEDCGSRTDIVVHSFNQFEMPMAYENIDYLKTLKYVMCAMASNDWLENHDEFISILNFQGVMAQNVNDGYVYRMFKEVGTTCNCGFVGLLTLLNYDIKEIFVAGMGFYNMGNYGIVYNSDYYNQVTRMNLFEANETRGVTPKEAREDLHRQQPQIDYLRKLLWRDKRITVDEYLVSNLAVNLSLIKDKDLYIDIDGVLCISEHRFVEGPFQGEYDYSFSTPILNNIDLVNELSKRNRITIWTARGQRTGKIDWSDFTKSQLSNWGVVYHEINFDKPHFDLLWDDRSVYDHKTFLDRLKTMK